MGSWRCSGWATCSKLAVCKACYLDAWLSFSKNPQYHFLAAWDAPAHVGGCEGGHGSGIANAKAGGTLHGPTPLSFWRYARGWESRAGWNRETPCRLI